MNKRIMKKKYNKWETNRMYNMTVSFDDVSFVFEAFAASGKTDLQKFVTSKNAKKAVKSYCKKHVWYSGACDNVRDMYRYMCEDIHNEREYQKRMVQQLKEQSDEFWDMVTEEYSRKLI